MSNIVFIGTSSFAVPILKKIVENNYIPIAVVTRTDKAVGRKKALIATPIKVLAQQYGLAIYDADKIDDALVEKLTLLKPDLIVVVAYGKVLPKAILDIPKIGSVNIHPSLLPRWRGASPLQFTILNGDKTVGVTIMLMDELLDHGPIIAQREVVVPDNTNAIELGDSLSKISAELLLEILPKIINKQIKITEQDHTKATFTKLLCKEDGLLDCSRPVVELDRQIRAFYGWPGTFIEILGGQKLKIIQARIGNSGSIIKIANVGKLFVDQDKKLGLVCSDGYLLLQAVQLDGKKQISGEEFINGHRKMLQVVAPEL